MDQSIMRKHTNALNATANPYVPLNGGEKLIANAQQPRSTSPPKPKFLPYLTKKPVPLPKQNAGSSRTLNSPLNFAKIVTPHSEKPTEPKLANPKHATSPTTSPDTPILNLPLDIWHLITLDLPQSTLNSLTQAHSTLHGLLLPLLYRNIDLTLSSLLSTSKPDANKYRSRSPYALLVKFQYLFTKQILSHPELALHVKSLKWTLGLERHGLLPEIIQGEEVVWSDEDLLRVFELMSEVRKLDIGVSTRSHGFPSQDNLRSGLFPNAHEIKLGGIMKRKLVLSILQPRTLQEENTNNEKGKQQEFETTQLKSLHLDDLQEESAPPSTSATQRALPYNSSDLPRLGPCQPMQHLLNPSLYERCKTLQKLHIKVYGMSERGTSDDELWAEWAIFLANVKPKEVVFDCDRLLKKKSSGRLGPSALRVARGRVSVANDRRFGETLLPVLKEGWEGLRRVEVRGVGESVVRDLEGLEERGVEVVFDRHNEEGYKSGTPALR